MPSKLFFTKYIKTARHVIHFAKLTKLALFKAMPYWLLLNRTISDLTFVHKTVNAIYFVHFIPIVAAICDSFSELFKSPLYIYAFHYFFLNKTILIQPRLIQILSLHVLFWNFPIFYYVEFLKFCAITKLAHLHFWQYNSWNFKK